MMELKKEREGMHHAMIDNSLSSVKHTQSVRASTRTDAQTFVPTTEPTQVQCCSVRALQLLLI